MKAKSIVLIVVLIFTSAAIVFFKGKKDKKYEATKSRLKLYWFIPDGLRSEDEIFKIYEWAEQGLLPNIKRLMDRGSYGFSIPTFPGHTPTNFATLLTGSTPRIHGIADGPMHIEGFPLKMVSKGGFSSVSKKVPPITYTLEERGYRVAALSVPGTTPPELDMGVTLRGRWGGWGIDFPSVIFQSKEKAVLSENHENRVFYFGPELTKKIDSSPFEGWGLEQLRSFSEIRQLELENWGKKFYGLVYDSTDDGEENYDRLVISQDKKTLLLDLKVGEWSDWIPVSLEYQLQNDYNINTPDKKEWERELSAISVDTFLKVRVIKLGKKGFFRIRFIYDSLNPFSVEPSDWDEEIRKVTGPMVDYVDSYPAQLIHFEEDKKVFIEESMMSFDWHSKLVGFAVNKMKSEVVIHNIYSPNQMLTSRWWMGHVDPSSDRYAEISSDQRKLLMNEILDLYKRIDEMIGEILRNSNDDSVIVLSSDHGAIPFNKEVRLNNLFAKKGLLKYNYDKEREIFEVDWEKTKAIYLKMDGIYLNPKGLGGNYKRASGEDYTNLRNQVIEILENLKDENGVAPLDRFLLWEQAKELKLPEDRVADLIIANKGGYNWSETISKNHEVFYRPLVSGYKQAVRSKDNKGMWTPFIISGPGVKKGYKLSKPISHIRQYPTIFKILGEKIPDFVEGKPLDEVFD